MQGSPETAVLKQGFWDYSRHFDEETGLVLKHLRAMTALVSLGVLVAGCATSPIPVSENFPLTVQPKVRSAGHWGLLSKDIVAQTLDTLDRAGAGASPLFVATPENASTFDTAFREFLISELVKAGKVVQGNPTGALQLTYKAQVVRHNSPRPHFVPGRFTMIAAGLFAAYGLRHEHLDTQLAGGLALAGIADYVASVDSGGPTATELVLTTTVASGDRYLTRKTDVYYIEEADETLFAALRAPKTMKVVGP